MSALDELIAMADKLCSSLEKAAENEKKFCDDVLIELERYSWEVYRMKNDLTEIKYYCGV